MKAKLIFLPILLLLLVACEDNKTSPKLELSQTTFSDVSYDEGDLSVNVVANEAWTASSSAAWCTLSATSGTGDAKLTLSVTGNINTTRTATITITTTSELKQTITVTQSAMASGDEYHYKLPVIFHVLYKDKSDSLQYTGQKQLAYLLKVVNSLYQNSGNSIDMNLEFKLATTNESGDTLTTPGVEYVYWQNTPMDCSAFMSNNTGQYVSLLWDPNKYINVMFYNFTTDNSGSTTLGITHLPFSTTGSNYLEGLNSTTATSLTKSNLKFPYCVSINSLYAYEESGMHYNPYDVTVTLAHELGHYLGLHHTFSEDEDGNLTTSCINSDYCDDTPSYDRAAYEKVLTIVLQQKDVTMDQAATRESCETSKEFVGHNIMDYEVCYSDQFTSDQRTRIRHVLAYSPLIPGPKKTSTTKSVNSTQGPMDLPIMMRKCGIDNTTKNHIFH